MRKLIQVLLLLPLALMAEDKLAYRVDSYASLKSIADSDHVVFCIPSLVSTLLRRETDKQKPLTEEETILIRDKAPAVLIPKGKEKAVVQARGYDDIDPEKVWPEWQKARTQFKEKTEANKSPEATTLARTPAADAPVAPAVGRASS